MSTKLSAVVVTYNEAHFLDECLKRLTFCDEVLVVDLGSRDDSVAIAERLGARVVHHEWVPFAEKVRDFAMGLVRGDWIVFVDPDLFIPVDLGEKLRELLGQHTEQGLGMVYLPLYTYFGSQPLRYGHKGGRRGFLGVIHRQRVEITGLLHFQGVRLLDGSFALCLIASDDQVISHYWIDSLDDAIEKGRRYLPYEPEKRRALGQTFSWKHMFLELYRSLKVDLKMAAFSEWPAVQVMFFQLWYIWKANMSLRRAERTKDVHNG